MAFGLTRSQPADLARWTFHESSRSVVLFLSATMVLVLVLSRVFLPLAATALAQEAPGTVGAHFVATSAHTYDGAVHSVQAHTSEAAPAESRSVPDVGQGMVATATGSLSVLWPKSVAANTGLSSDLTALVDANVVNSGRTVIGSYPGYVASAEARRASYFSIGDKWDALGARGQDPWALHRHSLDGRIAAGDSVYSTVPKGSINPGAYLARETQHLLDNGYQWVKQWALKPSG